MALPQLPKLESGVRFPSLALPRARTVRAFFFYGQVAAIVAFPLLRVTVVEEALGLAMVALPVTTVHPPATGQE